MSNSLTSGPPLSEKARLEPSVPVPSVSVGLVNDADTWPLSSWRPPLSGIVPVSVP